jgi:hypothetical protein
MTARVASLLLMAWSFAFYLSCPAPAAPLKTISAAEYRAKLQKADAQLQKLEARAPRNITPILQPLAQDQIVRRADGKTQAAGGEQWKRLPMELSPAATGTLPPAPTPIKKAPGQKAPGAVATPPSVSREDVRRVREIIALRLRALDDWAGSSYQNADAQTIIRQLENSGQIRTGPTWLEQTWTNFWKWVSRTFQNFLKWVGNWFPEVSPGKMPAISGATVKLLFTLTVVALLAAIALFIWRAIGGKVGRGRKNQGAFAFSPEDAELLALPPDELRERANRFADNGNYREALRHLYIALLLNFDARGVWRYDARRTNWEHISALKSEAAKSGLVAPLSDITRRFDRVRYGNAPCAQTDWQRFERDVNALESGAPGN